MSKSILFRVLSRLTVGTLLLGLLPAGAAAQGNIEVWGGWAHWLVYTPPAGSVFTQVAAGEHHALALRSDGTIAAWGLDWQGSTADTPTWNGFVQVRAISSSSMALHADGTVLRWGASGPGLSTLAPAGSGITYIGEGGQYGIDNTGTIASWGSAQGSPPAGNDFTKVASGWFHSIALRSDGSLVSWGNDSYNLLSGTPGGTGFIDITAYSYVSLALRADGSVVAWGDDSSNQVAGIPTGTGYTQIVAGGVHCMALRASGEIDSWGEHAGGIVSNTPSGTGFTQLSAGVALSVVLRSFNSTGAYCLGDGHGTPCPCGANSTLEGGCKNSTGAGATLMGGGVAELSADTFHLAVAGTSNVTFGMLLRGADQLNGGYGNPLADGLLCTSGQTARSQAQLSSAGSTNFTDFQGAPFGASSYGPGVPTNYQYWYRDQGNFCSGGLFNFSNAWTVTWMP